MPSLSLSLPLFLYLSHSWQLKLSQATKFTLHSPAASAVGGLLKLRIRRVLNEVPAAAAAAAAPSAVHGITSAAAAVAAAA